MIGLVFRAESREQSQPSRSVRRVATGTPTDVPRRAAGSPLTKGLSMSPRTPSAHPSAYDHLDERERARVLAALLDERSALRAEVERLAVRLLGEVRIESVAVEIRTALVELELADLAVRAGRQPGGGYVHETDAAYDLVEGAVQPFVDDLRRRARLGMREAAAKLALGVLTGLYRCRDPSDGTVLAYAGTDTPEELAAWVVDETAKAQVEMAPADVASACPDWERLA
jgi:hypothetical protein